MSYTTPPTKATGENVTLANWNTHLKANLDALHDGTGIADGAIVTARIADSAVTTALIADDAVTAAKIAAGAVGSSEIADGAVTSSEMEDNTNSNITLANSWTNTGGSYHSASAQKDPTNRVYLRGVVTAPASANTTIGTVPSGYRPWATEVFICARYVDSTGAWTHAQVSITSGGTITVIGGIAASDLVSLSGITYHSDV